MRRVPKVLNQTSKAAYLRNQGKPGVHEGGVTSKGVTTNADKAANDSALRARQMAAKA